MIIGGALVGASWYLFRLSRNPDGQSHNSSLFSPLIIDRLPLVIWTKSNPTPWNTIQQDENIKMMSGNHKFDKRSGVSHTRERFLTRALCHT